MNAERWKRVSEVFQQALSQPSVDRERFINDACAGDEDLRQEVQSLLNHGEQAENCLKSPLTDLLARDGTGSSTGWIGHSLLHYRIIEQIGEGGMGVVYLAMDSRLRREVALKVLPSASARNPERMARHRREAHILASLNHNNIAAIYGLEEFAEVNFLVLELIKGETLNDRLARTGPVQQAEACKIAHQIAEALEYAHKKGVTHRDIKPSNIKLTPEGDVKVLDFGLAKAFRGEEAGVELSELATQSLGPTREGQILGTPAYMSPEQVRGRDVDKLTDIWAFGCVVYELLTARPAFQGRTPSDTLAGVLGRDPDWRALPASTPENIRRLLRRCLQKDPKHRLHDIADARIEIEEGDAEPATGGGSTRGFAGRLGQPRRLAFASVILLGVILMTLAVWGWFRPQAPVPGTTLRMTVTLPEEVTVTRGPGFGSSSLALSPDGSTLVVAGTRGDSLQLYERPLNRIEVIPLAGTEGGSSPFFSPDGAWIGFFADGHLKRVPAGGGAAVEIAAVPGYPAAG